jgi:hypothetical protein
MRAYTDCYIAFIDLLGFKDYVGKHSCEEIASLFDEINEDYNITIQGLNSPWVNSEIVKKKVMSDTICFYVDSSESDSLARLVASCAYFQVKLMRMPCAILSRGAIVKDKNYACEDTTFGPGVSKAYLLEEKTAVTPRIILDNSIRDFEKLSLTTYGKKYLDMYIYEDFDYLCIDSLFLFYCLCHDKDSWKLFALHVENMIRTETKDNILNKYKYIYSRFSYISNKLLEFTDI